MTSPLDESRLLAEQVANKKETTFALKLFNYLGIAFIFLAILSAGYLSLAYITPLIQSVLLYLVAFAFGAAGHFFAKRGQKLFALGLTGGGIGLLYIVSYVSYFVLGVLSVPVMIGILFFITTIGITISLHYRSESLVILSLVGGYLPIGTLLGLVGIDVTTILVAQAYVLCLHLLMMYLYHRNSWQLLYRVSFIAVLPWLIRFTYASILPWYVNYGYQLIYLLIYSILPLTGQRAKCLSRIDEGFISASVLIFLCATFSYGTAQHSGRNLLLLLLTFLLAGGASFWLRDKKSHTLQQLSEGIVLLLASFTLALYVPLIWLQDHAYMLYGIWVLLIGYVLWNKRSNDLKVAILLWLHYFAFYFCLVQFAATDSLLSGGYGVVQQALLLAGMIVCYLLTQRTVTHTTKRLEERQLQQVSFVMLYLQTLYVIFVCLEVFSYPRLDEMDQILVTFVVYFIGHSLLYRYHVARRFYIPQLAALVFAGSLLFINGTDFDLFGGTLPGLRLALITLLNIAVPLSLLYAAYDSRKEVGMTTEGVIITSVAYLLLNGTIFSWQQATFSGITILLDIVYALFAAALLFIGFRQQYVHMRRIGLYGLLFVMAKLIFIDISIATLLAKTIAFFVFGVISLAISYLYQRQLQLLEQGEAAEEVADERGA